MSVTNSDEETYHDPTEERELRLHLLTKRRSEIAKEREHIEREIAEICRNRN